MDTLDASGTAFVPSEGMAEESAETVTTSLRISRDLLDVIRDLADVDERSVNYVLVKAIRQYAEQHATSKGKRKE